MDTPEKEPFKNGLEFLFGAGQELHNRLSAKLAEISKELAKEAVAPPETGAQKGSKYDEMLTHLYRLTFAPHVIGDIIGSSEYVTADGKIIPMVRISTSRRIVEGICPEGFLATPGASVRLNLETNQIIGLAHSLGLGPVANIREVGEDYVVVEVGGSVKKVHKGLAVNPSRGDRVALDEMQLVIVGTLPKASDSFVLDREPQNSFADIVGHEDAVRLLCEEIDRDAESDPYARHYGRKPTKGFLFFGPPGCGKSMFGEAVAHRVATRHGKKALASGYIYVDGPKFLDKYVGETERAIRFVFEDAERHLKEQGYRATIVFDEGEALFSRRGENKSGADMEKTVVPTFLGLMNKTSARVLFMTNRVDVVDPAVIRDGRFNKQYFIGRPTRQNAEIIIAKNLARYPTDTSVEVLARMATEAFYDPKWRLLDEPLPLVDGEAYFTMGNIVNGAMLARLVDDISELAERRDRTQGRPSGITTDDVIAAVNALYTQKKNLDHRDELTEFFTSMKDRLPKDGQRQARGS